MPAVDQVGEDVERVGAQFAEAHNGLLPTDVSQLTAYLKKPIDPRKIQDFLSKVPSGVTTLQQLQAMEK